MLIQNRTLAAFILLVIAAPWAGAQQPVALGTARVTLVAGPSPSRGARTEVWRRAQRSPQNVVIVDRNATAEDLAAALSMIGALRFQYGDSLTFDFRARPETIRPGPTWQKSAYRTWLVQQLVRLRAAPPGKVTDLGVVRAVQITLPAPRGALTGGETVTK
jgi:hypothetical protein